MVGDRPLDGLGSPGAISRSGFQAKNQAA